MKVYINNQPNTINDAHTLVDALKIVGFDQQKGIAVAVNNQVVPRANWEQHTIQEEDKITIIKATQGG